MSDRDVYLEPCYLNHLPIEQLLDETIVKRMDQTGDEKKYTLELCNYLLAPQYPRRKEISPGIIDSLLLRATEREQAFPSLISILLDAGAYAYAPGNGTPINSVLTRLELNPKDGIAAFQLQKMLAAAFVDKSLVEAAHSIISYRNSTQDVAEIVRFAREEGVAIATWEDLRNVSSYVQRLSVAQMQIEERLGKIGEGLSSQDYIEVFPDFLAICQILQAPMKELRTYVAPFLAKKISTKRDYVVKKSIQQGLNSFQKLAFSCVVCEYLTCLASSWVQKDLYDLDVYAKEGKVFICKKQIIEDHDKQKDYEIYQQELSIKAERHRARLAPEAHALLEKISAKL